MNWTECKRFILKAAIAAAMVAGSGRALANAEQGTAAGRDGHGPKASLKAGLADGARPGTTIELDDRDGPLVEDLSLANLRGEPHKPIVVRSATRNRAVIRGRLRVTRATLATLAKAAAFARWGSRIYVKDSIYRHSAVQTNFSLGPDSVLSGYPGHRPAFSPSEPIEAGRWEKTPLAGVYRIRDWHTFLGYNCRATLIRTPRTRGSSPWSTIACSSAFPSASRRPRIGSRRRAIRRTTRRAWAATRRFSTGRMQDRCVPNGRQSVVYRTEMDFDGGPSDPVWGENGPTAEHRVSRWIPATPAAGRCTCWTRCDSTPATRPEVRRKGFDRPLLRGQSVGPGAA